MGEGGADPGTYCRSACLSSLSPPLSLAWWKRPSGACAAIIASAWLCRPACSCAMSGLPGVTCSGWGRGGASAGVLSASRHARAAADLCRCEQHLHRRHELPAVRARPEAARRGARRRVVAVVEEACARVLRGGEGGVDDTQGGGRVAESCVRGGAGCGRAWKCAA